MKIEVMLLGEKELSEKNSDLVKEVENIKKIWANLEILSSNISSRFFGDISINDAINATLRDMGILTGSSRVILFIFKDDNINLNHTYEWCAEGINPLFQYFQNSWIINFPWWDKQLRKGNIVNISNINILPNEAQATKRLLKVNKIKSLLAFPLYNKAEVSGFIGYTNDIIEKEWKENDLSPLRLSSQMIGNALEKHKIEYFLKESEEKYRLIIENINDLIVIINDNFRIEYANEDTIFRLLGYQKRDIIGKSSLDFIHPDDVEQAIYTFKKGLQPGESVVELRFKHKNESWLWFESSGQTFIDKEEKLKGIIISRDITERKSAEERYKSLFDNSPNAIIIVDLNGKIIDANPTTKILFGLNKNDIVGKSIEQYNNIFHTEFKQYFKRIFKASFLKDFPEPIEVKVKNSVGEYLWVETQASIIKQNNKTLIQLIFEDITKKKKIEILENKFKEELENEVQLRTKELNEALTQQKLFLDQIVKSSQFKTEFMATMSHELRTPLNAIIGFTDLLLEGVYGDLRIEQREFISDIKSSAEHQFDMIKNILDISKIESGQIELNIQQITLNTLVDQIKSSLRPLYKQKDLRFKVKGLKNEIIIYADPIRFKEILLNLLSNAIKFTIDGTITLIIKERANHWLFEVNDTGIGIAQKDFPSIFKEFKRVDSTYVRSVPGTGLGLSLTKRLVELHGGELSFTSVLGVGSSFVFTISKKLEEKIGD
ncbi:MAG: PAS domain S-box protein [Promethearchaeota archaeon]